MPSNLRSNTQSGPVNRSWVSVAAIGSSQSGMPAEDIIARLETLVHNANRSVPPALALPRRCEVAVKSLLHAGHMRGVCVFITRGSYCLAGAGYSSSIERERRRGRVQFSTVSPLTRANSAVLLVTSLSPRLRA